jgi:hypothetical protein
MIGLGDWIDAAGIVACELQGMDGFEVWLHFALTKDKNDRVWVCSQRNHEVPKRYKSLQAAVNVLRELGVHKFEVLYV